MNKIQKLIEEICEKHNINFKILSKDWVIMLEKDDKTRFIIGYKFDLNNYAIGSIADDKYALYCVLKNKNIPVVEHEIFFKTSINKKKLLLSYFNSHNRSIVIKPNNGTCGINVYHITNEDDLIEKANHITKNSTSFCLSPFYNIKNEYRVIILNNEYKIVYRKVKPTIIGNGINTIKELLHQFNDNYFDDEKVFKNDIDINIIPQKGEIIEYEWKFNLSRGATISTDISKEIFERIIDIAMKAIKVTNLKFCSVDIIEDNDKNFLILEINSGVMMLNFIDLIDDGYNIAKKIYEEAIIEMFK